MMVHLALIYATASVAYHGEIGIDPSSGTILRLTVEADPELGSAMERKTSDGR
jgi:hypothetical protein